VGSLNDTARRQVSSIVSLVALAVAGTRVIESPRLAVHGSNVEMVIEVSAPPSVPKAPPLFAMMTGVAPARWREGVRVGSLHAACRPVSGILPLGALAVAGTRVNDFPRVDVRALGGSCGWRWNVARSRTSICQLAAGCQQAKGRVWGR
jgi:hypothetical protein